MTSNSSGSTQLGTQSQPRPSSSSVLWAHLQRKDTTNTASNPIPLPPLAPLDKTSTSLRILLHDTQSHFETFAAKANILTKGVDEAKREIGLTKTLFEKEHEVLSNEMFGLANRCQTEILKAVGEPAQASRLADLQVAVQLRLEGLDKRVDSMQMLYQSNAQTLQAQTQALQTIQEQQSTILAALMPLLPLLQAVPLHIETARSTVQETIAKGFEIAAAAKVIPSPPKTRTRSTSPTKPQSAVQEKSPWSGRKRRRIDENSAGSLQQQDSRLAGPSPPKPSLAAPSSILRRRSLQKGNSSINAPPAPVRPPLTNLDLKTPRRPLADLHLGGSNSLLQARKMSLNSRRGSSVFAPTPNPSRIPQLPPRADSVAPTALTSTVQALSSTPQLVQHIETPQGSNLRILQATPSTAIGYRTQGSAVHRRTSTILPHDGVLGPNKSFSMAPPSLRQRRSPFRQGRRFIPLDDSDDSEAETKEG